MRKTVYPPIRRAQSRRSRDQVLREAKARHRAQLHGDGQVLVTVPISEEANLLLKETAEACGKTAIALMTELLEEAANRSPPKRMSGNADSIERERLESKYARRLIVNPLLTRKLVSFQASKAAPFYRWLKYKEAFSPELVDYLYDLVHPQKRKLHILDPFAGTGTALTRACARGWQATGIELLPIGTHALKARFAADSVDLTEFEKSARSLASLDWNKTHSSYRFPHIRISKDAFSSETEKQISAFVHFLESITDDKVRFLFWFACLSVLENVSFTRKDGQYLRWDYRGVSQS